MFIQQIKLVTESERRLKNAQRASFAVQLSGPNRVREHRIDPSELDDFDATLCEKWEAQHASAVDGLL